MSITDGLLYFHNDRKSSMTGTNGALSTYFDFQDEISEFYNFARTRALVDAMRPPSFEFTDYGHATPEALWTLPTSFYRFGSTTAAVPTSPGDPANPAPWYRAGSPESSEACGIYVFESSGDGAAHHGRTAIARNGSGSNFTPNRAAERVIVCRAVAIGTTQRGANYMYRWAEQQLLDLGSGGPLNWENILFRLWAPDIDEIPDYADIHRWTADGLVKGDGAVALDPPSIEVLSNQIGNLIQFTFTIGVGQPTLTSLHTGVVVDGVGDRTPIIGAGLADDVVPIVNVAGGVGAVSITPRNVSLDISTAAATLPLSTETLRFDYAARRLSSYDPYEEAYGGRQVTSANVRRRAIFDESHQVNRTVSDLSPWGIHYGRGTRADRMFLDGPAAATWSHILVNAIGLMRTDFT